MQNSMWKMATLLGVIGVGCLVVLQLQKGLPNRQTALAGLQPAGDAVPNTQEEPKDPFSFDGFDEDTTSSTPAADPFSPADGQSEPEMDFGEQPFGETTAATTPQPAASSEFDDMFGEPTTPATATTGVTPAGATRMAAAPVTSEQPAFGDDMFGDSGSAAATSSAQPGVGAEDPFGASAAADPFGPDPVDSTTSVQLRATPASSESGAFGALEPTPGNTAPPTDFGGDDMFGSPTTEAQPVATPPAQDDDPWSADTAAAPTAGSGNTPPQPLPTPDEFGREPIDEFFPDETATQPEARPAPATTASRVDLSTGPALPQPAPLDDWSDGSSAPAVAAPQDQRDPFAPDPTPPNPIPDVERVPETSPYQFDRFGDEASQPEPAPLRIPDGQPASIAITPQEPRGSQFEPQLSATPAVQSRPARSNTPPAARVEQFDQIRPITATRPAPSLDSVPHGTLKPQLQIAKSAPGTGAIGKPLIYSIKIRNVGNAVADDVVVEDYIPKGARLTGTIPQAELINDRLTWKFPRLEPNQEQEIKIRVVPEKEGQIGSVATVRMKTEIGSRTTITAPKLKLELQAKQDAKVGETIVLRYRITNTGSGDATKVILQHALPTQLQHSMGADLEYEVGDLPAGASKDVTLQLVAAQAGEAQNTAVVTAEGGIKDRANTTVSILGAQLKVTRRGPARRYLNRTAVYENTVTNTTHRDSDPATLIEHVPEGMEYVESNGGQYSPIKRTVAWSVPTIRSGEKVTFQVQLKPIASGTHESLVQVVEQTGFKSQANSRTQVVNLNNMGLGAVATRWSARSWRKSRLYHRYPEPRHVRRNELNPGSADPV